MNTRMQEIFDLIARNPGLKEREIADRVGLKKSPYTRKILMDLIAEGSVARAQAPDVERLTYVYFIQQTNPLPGMEQ